MTDCMINRQCLYLCLFLTNFTKMVKNKKFELMLTRRAKAYSSSGSVV